MRWAVDVKSCMSIWRDTVTWLIYNSHKILNLLWFILKSSFFQVIEIYDFKLVSSKPVPLVVCLYLVNLWCWRQTQLHVYLHCMHSDFPGLSRLYLKVQTRIKLKRIKWDQSINLSKWLFKKFLSTFWKHPYSCVSLLFYLSRTGFEDFYIFLNIYIYSQIAFVLLLEKETTNKNSYSTYFLSHLL